MRRSAAKSSTRSFSLLILILAFGCDQAPAPGPPDPDGSEVSNAVDPVAPVALTDDAGRTVILEGHPVRVISLVPSATRILIALGEASRLVARTEFDSPESVPELATLPTVGGGLEPSIERILSLEPDLVVRFHAESDPVTPRLLDGAGIPHLAIRPDRIADVRRIIGLLGQTMGTEDAADSLVAELDGSLAGVSRRVEGASRPLVVFVLGGDPPLIPGPGTYLQELVALAGGRNAFEDLDLLYAPVSVEEVIRRDVEIVLAPEGATIPAALRHLPIRRVPPDIQLPGLDVGFYAWELARIFHPDRFP